MANLTAIELGPDTCAFARTSGRRGAIRLLASEILDPAAFPGAEAFAVAARRTRRTLNLPRRCRVVVWGLPDGANRKDAEVKPLIQPLVDAGFKVERVVTPCNALAALARQKTSRGDVSTCWVAINRGGVAIVAVRPGKLLYAHSFAWDSTMGSRGSQARLLQRYLLVSHLSPQVKRAMAEARKAGSPVGVVVTCGNLPDLRSLTMPLIEELDIEVETLDSLEGLLVKPDAAEKLGETASAIRLACAAVIARGSRPWDPSKKKSSRTGAYVAAAVLAALLVGLAYQWYARRRSAAVLAPATQSQQTRAPLPAPQVAPPAVSVPVAPPKSNPPAVSAPVASPKAAPAPVTGPKPNAARPRDIAPPSTPAPPGPPVTASTPAARPSSPALDTPAVPADKPGAGLAVRPAVPGVGGFSPRPIPELLGDAVPRVTAILVSPTRRYATIEGGRIIGVGDVIGRRTVVSMDERSVVLREPSGAQIRIGLGGRVLGFNRDVR
jgi:hypothetical protein